MYIIKFQIKNYKCFLDSNAIQLNNGFNSIVGKNDTGKTALLEALSLRFGLKPHRSITTLPSPRTIIGREAECVLNISITKDEFWNIFIKNPRTAVKIPFPGNISSPPFNMFTDQLNDINTFHFKLKGNELVHGFFENWSNIESSRHYTVVTGDNIEEPFTSVNYNGGGSNYDALIYNELVQGVYSFKAERFNIGKYNFGPETILLPNASNLPQVLNTLQGKNPSRFNKLKIYLKEIYPQIQSISVRPSDTSLEIIVWKIDPDTEREDLAIPLSESGTGIGQIIAILYVVLTSEFSRIIIIDEPQSFLHPGAARKLINILREMSKNTIQHQFIFGTHSPTILAASDPSQIILVRQEGSESKCTTINKGETEKMGVILSEIGVRLSDVFGADSILWVEGKTEEICFPRIIEHLCKNQLRVSKILSVYSTSDLNKKDLKKVVSIYKKISNGYSLVPPTLGIILDIEDRTQEQCNDLTRESNNVVKFIPRRMFENYLINPHCIEKVLTNLLNNTHPDVNESKILQWLGTNKWNKKYFKRIITKENQNEELWLKKVHGANLLADLFKELSEGLVTYRKTEYSIALTKCIIANSPDDFIELANFLDQVFDSSKEQEN